MGNVINDFHGEYRFLSNFWNHPVTYDGATYPNNEAAFQAAKCADPAQKKMFQAMDPSSAKRAGRRVRLRPDWESVKVGIMEGIVRAKFAPGTELAEKLLATGDAELVEGNAWNDTFWGVCRGRGRNELGKILMKVRNELKNA